MALFNVLTAQPSLGSQGNRRSLLEGAAGNSRYHSHMFLPIRSNQGLCLQVSLSCCSLQTHFSLLCFLEEMLELTLRAVALQSAEAQVQVPTLLVLSCMTLCLVLLCLSFLVRRMT